MSVHFVALLNVYVHLCVYLIQVSLGLFCLLHKRMCIMVHKQSAVPFSGYMCSGKSNCVIVWVIGEDYTFQILHEETIL